MGSLLHFVVSTLFLC